MSPLLPYTSRILGVTFYPPLLYQPLFVNISHLSPTMVMKSDGKETVGKPAGPG